MVEIKPAEVTAILRKELAGYQDINELEEVGTVLQVGDGIARIYGLSNAESGELIEFQKNGLKAIVLNLEEDNVGAVLLGESYEIKEGDTVKRTRRIASINVGEGLLGRVINTIGEPIDGKGKIEGPRYEMPLERKAPGVIFRQPVNQPLQTGIKAIDAMIPIGRGQRELIIGDRQIGKTAIAIDTIINQREFYLKGEPVYCIYVAIGQKESKVANIVAKLEESGAMKYTVVVVAGASDPASLLYIAPYAGTAMAEYFLDKGEDVLVVYDDLSKHAVSYREISLLLKRPPGREAYPGDVFYLHSRLLERACKLNKDFGGGSITSLPIIETQAGDVAAYIPTNVISITDGQIYLEPDLFYQGNRPAVNVGISVSRVGSAAQIKAMKKVAGKIKLEAAQYRELAAFAQFGSDLDEATKRQLERGKRLFEIFKQDQYSPVSVEEQVLIYFAVSNGYMDDVPVEKIKDFEIDLLEYARDNAKESLSNIKKTGQLEEKDEEEFKKVIQGCKDILDYLIKKND